MYESTRRRSSETEGLKLPSHWRNIDMDGTPGYLLLGSFLLWEQAITRIWVECFCGWSNGVASFERCDPISTYCTHLNYVAYIYVSDGFQLRIKTMTTYVHIASHVPRGTLYMATYAIRSSSGVTWYLDDHVMSLSPAPIEALNGNPDRVLAIGASLGRSEYKYHR